MGFNSGFKGLRTSLSYKFKFSGSVLGILLLQLDNWAFFRSFIKDFLAGDPTPQKITVWPSSSFNLNKKKNWTKLSAVQFVLRIVKYGRFVRTSPV